MQTPSIETAVAVGLDGFTLADLRSTHHPDRRFARLQRRPPDWNSMTALIDGLFGDDERWPWLRNLPALTAAAIRACIAIDMADLLNAGLLAQGRHGPRFVPGRSGSTTST